MQFLANSNSERIEGAHFNIGCGGVTNRQEIPDANDWQTRTAQIFWQDPDNACSLTTFCGTEAGLMQSFDFRRSDYTGDGPFVAQNVCPGTDYFVLSYVALCNCDDGTGQG